MGVGSVDWFRSYLTGRKQCVNVNGTDSDFLEITCGVPQGSILGPTLFLCYINDMCSSLDCRLSLYADDSTLMASGKNVNELSLFLTDQLESCSRWLVDNRLSLHVDKCEAMLFGSCSRMKVGDDFKVQCFGKEIRRVSGVKYLGIYLDEKLSGNEQAMAVLKKISSRLAFLYRKAPFLNQRCRRLLCMSLIQPFFDYCCSSWYSSLSFQLKESLDVMQRKMIRFVYGLHSRSTINSSHLANIGWLSVRDRVRFFKLLHAYRIHHGLAPKYISGSFVTFSSFHSHNTRGSSTNFLITKEDSSRSIMLNSFSYTVKKEWNSLPIGLKSITSYATFKTRLREFLFKTY